MIYTNSSYTKTVFVTLFLSHPILTLYLGRGALSVHDDKVIYYLHLVAISQQSLFRISTLSLI